MKKNVHKLTGLALLAALIVVLQLFAPAIKIGPYSMALSLIPIVVGAISYGPLSGGLLGAVCAAVIAICVVQGLDQGGFLMFQYNAVATIVLIFLKTTLAGFIGGLAYKLLKDKNETLGVYACALLVPVINTGLFSLAVLTIFRELTEGWAAAEGITSVTYYVLVFLAGVNFLLEVLINVLLAPIVNRVVKIRG